MIRLGFHGAAGTVTGSKYLLEVDRTRVLIDCGLFQGLKELRQRNWEPLPFKAATVHGVVFTHAHIDHIGYFPRFVKAGFAGPAFCTPATEAIAELLLLDTAKIEESDAEYANKRAFAKHQPALPLFDVHAVRRAMKRMRTVPREEWFNVAGPIWARYLDTGHLLGACMVEMEIRNSETPVRLLFSGDVGRYSAPLYHDPSNPPACDYLICESTYGDREHPAEPAIDELRKTVEKAVLRGGVMLIASFAVGRAQQIIYLLQVLIRQGLLPELPIFLDSPMAVAGMNIYRYYAEQHDLSAGLAIDDDYAFNLRHVRLVRTAEESKRINSFTGPGMIISSSGMMTGGRILHHLRQRLPDERNTVLLAGYMAEGTRGRALQNGARTLRIHGRDVPVRAAVVEMSGLSGHADRSELLRWLAPLPPPKQTFLTHGELPSAIALAEELRATRGWNTTVPKLGEAIELEG